MSLYVIKVGSATLRRPEIFAEIAVIASRARVLLVAGGAAGIEEHYVRIGREISYLRLRNGDLVRYCPPAEMVHVAAAYAQITLPAVRASLAGMGLTAFCATATDLVHAALNRPLRTVEGGRERIVRGHRAGTVTRVDTARLEALLDAYPVVVLSPPVGATDGGGPVNVDADVLAAELANALRADHLRLVTGTPGLLTDPADGTTTLPDAYPGTAGRFARDRMRQKVRAAERALAGSADVAITGPHTLAEPSGWTRFWREPEPDPRLRLLTRAVQIPSVSYDEAELAGYLAAWARERAIDAMVDDAGNLVATRGTGPRRLLLLGHLDTVPFHWPVSWKDGELSGRGSVDAKACLVSFLETLAELEVPSDSEVRVVGAVEEEVSSSKGAFHVRDHYPADAVIVGEPSGVGALTLGYFGLYKLLVTVNRPAGHSAGRDALSAPDALMAVLRNIREAVHAVRPEALSAVIDLHCTELPDQHRASAVLNFRIPPGTDLSVVRAAALACACGNVTIEMLRCTPGHAGGRSSTLARAFARAFGRSGLRPRYLVKKGTSDMNTLATTWHDVPMVAYGPGDSTLDHTETERIAADEYLLGRTVLADAVTAWLEMAE